MPCYCSVCPSSNSYRQRTIKNHLQDDCRRLESCAVDKFRERELLERAVKANQAELSRLKSAVSGIDDRDRAPSELEDRHTLLALSDHDTHTRLPSPIQTTGSSGSISTHPLIPISQPQPSDLVDTPAAPHEKGAQLQEPTEEHSDIAACMEDGWEQSDRGGDIDEVSRRWWEKSDSDDEDPNHSGSDSSSDVDIPDLPPSNFVDPNASFFNIPESVSMLRSTLKGSYSLLPTPPPNPPNRTPLSPSDKLSLKHYSAWVKSNGTVEAYQLHAGVLCDSTGTEILSLYSVKQLAQKITGFVPKQVDMCPNSCIAYTGQYAALQRCPYLTTSSSGSSKKQVCNEPRYFPTTSPRGKQRPQAQVQILPVMATIQALFANETTSRMMRQRDACLKEALHLVGTAATGNIQTFSDFADSKVHQIHYKHLGIFQSPRDVAFAISTDGAQLTLGKQSNTWFLILIILSLPASIRYQSKNIIINFAIPGPKSPGDIESFLWCLFEEMAIASEGIWIWDALDSAYFVHHAFIVMALGDMLGSAKLNGLAGHSAFHGDRFSLVQGARSSLKQGAKYQYYPLDPPDTLDKKFNRGRPTIDLEKLPIRTQEHYWDTIRFLDQAQTGQAKKKMTKATGISRLPLCAASPAFLHPTFFPLDPFHLIYENAVPFFYDTWTTGSKPGDIVYMHPNLVKIMGELIPLAMATLPPSFCGLVRNIQLKRQSQYKIFEWMTLTHWYFVVMGIELGMEPSVLHNFAKLVEVIEYAMTIQPRSQVDIDNLQSRVNSFYEDYEAIYIGSNPEFIHRARLCVFQLVHIPRHIAWNGSVRMGSQATIERSIGEMGHKIRLRKAPFANLTNIIYQRELIKILALHHPDVVPKRGIVPDAADLVNKQYKLFQHHYFSWASSQKSDPFLQADLRALSTELGIDFLEDGVAGRTGVGVKLWGKLKLGQSGHTLSSQLSARLSRPERRSEWFEGPGLVFGRARAFYSITTSDKKVHFIATYNPFGESEKLLGYFRGHFDTGSVKCINVDAIVSLVGIWQGCTSQKTYILRKHPGIDLLSPDESGAVVEPIGAADEVEVA